MIRLEQIEKSFLMGTERVKVLHNINLHIKQGEFVSILGASGSGKSTLMNLIGCMDTFEHGTYYLNGEPIHELQDNQLGEIRNSYIGFVFQKYQLLPRYSVLQNVLLPLYIRGMSREQAYDLAIASIERVGLSNRLTHKPNELSGGQQQRVAIARALVTKPSLLLADEPTGALDSKTGREILCLFQELHEENHTIVMITHDNSVATYASRILQLTDGILMT